MCWVSGFVNRIENVISPFFLLFIYLLCVCNGNLGAVGKMLGWLEKPIEDFCGVVTLESNIGVFRKLFVNPAAHKL